MDTQQKNILIVDDSRLQRVMLQRLLEQNGFAVYGADSVTQGIAILSAQHVNLVMCARDTELTDLHRFIRDEHGVDAPPIIVIGSDNSDEQKKAALANGARRYIVRPFDESGLVALLHEEMAIPGSTSSVDAKPQDLTDPLVAENIRLKSELKRLTDAFSKAIAQSHVTFETRADSLVNLNHELRTPLNAILGLSALLRENTSRVHRIQYLEQIEAAGMRLLKLFDNAMTSPRADDDSANAICERIASRFVQLKVGDQHPLELRMLNDIEHLNGPVRLLEEAVFNLIEYASRHVADGPITLELSATNASETERSCLTFSVNFLGPVLSDAEQEALFHNKLSAGDDLSTKGEEPGLLLTRAVAERLNGGVGVNCLDAGNQLWLKVCLGAFTAVTTPFSQAASACPPVQNVLVVDDEPINRKITRSLLEELGLRVTTCANGREAFELLVETDTRFEMVFMDQLMPDMDGMEATARIRELEGMRELPIIGLSANGDEQSRQACLASGMNDYLVKSSDPSALYAAVSRWTSHSGAMPAEELADVDSDDAIAELTLLAQLQTTMPMLDTRVGKQVSGGKLEQLTQLLRQFRDRYKRVGEQFSQLEGSGDPQAAVRLAHSVKGSSATLGLTGISEQAAAIERRLKSAQDDADLSEIGRLDEMMNLFSQCLDNWLASFSSTSTGANVEVEYVLRHLGELLEADNPLAWDFFESYRSSIEKSSPALAAQLSGYIANYDLREALSLLKDYEELMTNKAGATRDRQS